jgi:proteasome accessory factor B
VLVPCSSTPGEKVIARHGTPQDRENSQPHHLLAGIRPLSSKSRIREAVEGYHNLSDAAFERTFERRQGRVALPSGCPDRGRQLRPTTSTMNLATASCPRSSPCRRSTWTPRKPLSSESPPASGGTRAWPSPPECAISKLRAAGVEPDAVATCFPGAVGTGVRARIRGAVECGAGPARVGFTYRDGSPRTLEPGALTSYKGVGM